MSLQPSASQTVGPYYSIGLAWLAVGDGTVIGPTPDPEAGPVQYLEFVGTVRDGAGQTVSDAMLEVWRPSVRGASPGASPPGSQPGEEAQELLAKQGFGRVRVEESGCFCFRVWPFAQVVKGHAPHLVVHVFMRGLLKAASTRIYLPDQVGHETDPVLKRVPSTRRSTLIASQVDEEPNRFRFDIHMQGANETVFFAY